MIGRTLQAGAAERRGVRGGPGSGRHIRARVAALGVVALIVAGACDEYPAEVERNPARAQPAGPPPATRPVGYEGYMEGGPVRSGFIMGMDGRPREVQYEVHDGRAIIEGDIVIGPADEVPATAAELMARAGSRTAVDGAQGIYVISLLRRWPGGIVPYEIHPFLNDDARIKSAIDVVEANTAGVDFVPRSGQSEYVRFVPGTDPGACSSPVGMVTGGQDIQVVPDCGGWSSIAHEILHSLGVRHEQSRCDRDDFVEIVWANIIPGREHNFVKQCDAYLSVLTYNESSIMHYSAFAFALIPDKPTIISKRGRDDEMGTRRELTSLDGETVSQMYGVFNDRPVAVIAPLAESYPEGTPVPFDASGSHDPDDERLWYDWFLGDDTCNRVGAPGYCDTKVANHAYEDDGVFDVQLLVSDYSPEFSLSEGVQSDVKDVTVTVVNVAPSIDFDGPATVDEGTPFKRTAHFSDPGRDAPWKLTVDYGAGAGAQPIPYGTNQSIALENTYADNRENEAPYTVHVTVTDDDGGTGEGDLPVTVRNAPPLVDAGPNATITSGEAFEFSGTFTDAGILDAPWNWQVDWGNGDETAGSTKTQGSPITGRITVCEPGDYTVLFSVTDKDGGMNVDLLKLTVPPFTVDLEVLPGGEPNPVNLKRGGFLPVAILSTPDFAATDVDLSTILLGDRLGTETPVAQHNNGDYQFGIEDVNGDGLPDLVPMFEVRALVANGDVTIKSTKLVLSASLADACTEILGEGPVVVR